MSAFQRFLIVVLSFVGSLGEFDLVPRYFLVWNRVEKMRDAVQACLPFVVGPYNVPGSVLGVGRFQHHVAGARIGVPTRVGIHVHRAQFPLAHRILNARLESFVLFLPADFQPELD